MSYSFLTPFYLAQHHNLLIINRVLLVLTFIFILFYLIKYRIHEQFSKGIFFILFYYISILLSSLLNSSIETRNIVTILMGLGFALLLNITIMNKGELLKFMLSINILLYVFVIINLILIYIYPEGIPSILQERGTRYYLFGNVNATTRYLLPGIMFSFLYDLLKYRKITTLNWILLILSWVTLIKVWAVTGILGLFIFTLIFLFNINRVRAYIIYIGSLLLSIGVTIFLVFYKYQNDLLAKILFLFNKDLTFSTRDVLWLNTITKIKDSLLFGYGFQNQEFTLNYIGNKYGAHNYFLDTLFRGGIFSLLILLLGLIYIGNNILKSSGSKVIKLMVATSASYFTMWIAEPFQTVEYIMFGILFILFLHVKNIESNFTKESLSEVINEKVYINQ